MSSPRGVFGLQNPVESVMFSSFCLRRRTSPAMPILSIGQ
jgi:hypothetical protein